MGDEAWTEMGDDTFAFRYLPESGSKKEALQVSAQCCAAPQFST